MRPPSLARASDPCPAMADEAVRDEPSPENPGLGSNIPEESNTSVTLLPKYKKKQKKFGLFKDMY